MRDMADLAEALQDNPSRPHGVSYVAEIGDRLVGHVQLSWSWLDARSRVVDVLVLSPLSVIPDHQRQGIGALVYAEPFWSLDCAEGHSRVGSAPP